MQDYITKQSLATLGIHLNDADSLISHFNEVAEEMIGDEIIDSLSDDEVEELVTLQESSATDEKIGEWIATHVPDYDQIVSNTIDIAIADMVEAAEGIKDATKE